MIVFSSMSCFCFPCCHVLPQIFFVYEHDVWDFFTVVLQGGWDYDSPEWKKTRSCSPVVPVIFCFPKYSLPEIKFFFPKKNIDLVHVFPRYTVFVFVFLTVFSLKFDWFFKYLSFASILTKLDKFHRVEKDLPLWTFWDIHRHNHWDCKRSRPHAVFHYLEIRFQAKEVGRSYRKDSRRTLFFFTTSTDFGATSL